MFNQSAFISGGRNMAVTELKSMLDSLNKVFFFCPTCMVWCIIFDVSALASTQLNQNLDQWKWSMSYWFMSVTRSVVKQFFSTSCRVAANFVASVSYSTLCKTLANYSMTLENIYVSYTSSLWSYHYGNLGLVTYFGVKVTFSSCSIFSFNHR